MKHLYVFIAVLLISYSVQAQHHWEWAKADTASIISTNPTYRKQAIAASGNKVLWSVLMNGKYNVNPASFGDNRITEYDVSGTPLTTRVLGGKVVVIDIEVDGQGNWYILGKYHDSMQYGSFIQTNSAVTAPYHFLMKLDRVTLQMQWYMPLGINYYASAESMCLRDRYLYIPLDSSQTTTVYKIDVVTGTRTPVVKQVKAGYVSSVAADDNGNIYVGGSCPSFGVDSFGNKAITFASTYDNYIVRYKANGEYDWSIFMHDITCNQRLLNLANNNTIYYTGTLLDSLTIGGISVKKPWTFGANYIAASLDSTGAVRWVRQVEDTIGSRADMTNLFNATVVDSSLVVAPAMRNYGDWGNGIAASFGNQSAAAYVKYSPSGTATWLRRTNSDFVIPQHIASNGMDVFVTGIARDSFSLDLDTVSVPLKPLTNTPFMAKLSGGPCEKPNVSYILAGTNGQVFWDPVSGAVRYEYSIETYPPPHSKGTITTSTSMMLVSLVPGTKYYICVRTLCANGSFSELSCIETTVPLNITKTAGDLPVAVYPNPAANQLNIAGLNNAGSAYIKLMGVTGNIVFEKNITSPSATEYIDVSQYARGIYFAEISTANGKAMQKIVLE